MSAVDPIRRDAGDRREGTGLDPIERAHQHREDHAPQPELGTTAVNDTHDIEPAILLRTPTARHNAGGVMEQHDTPREILRNPANQFVEDFLGGERGLKRLGLLPIGTAELVKGPVVDVTASDGEARQVMEDFDVDWFGILDGAILLGWGDGSSLDGGGVSVVRPRKFAVELTSDSSLREALDSVVTNHARVAVVVDDGVYRGMIDLDAIAEEITE